MAFSLRRAALAVALGLLAGMSSAGAADSRQPGAPQPPSIYVVTAKREPITETVRASGYIRPVEEVYVQPQVEGLAVDSTDVEIGDRVTKGQVMAVLADDALKLQLSQLQATKAKAEAALAEGRPSSPRPRPMPTRRCMCATDTRRCSRAAPCPSPISTRHRPPPKPRWRA